MAELRRAHQALEDITPQLGEARRRFFKTRSDEDRAESDRVQAEAERVLSDFTATLERAELESGLPRELLEAMEMPEPTGDRTDRRGRSTLTVDNVEATACLDDHLPLALNALTARLPAGWLDEEPADLFRFAAEDDGRPVSIVKGVRPESERPVGHRLRQMVYVARDRLSQHPRYDHFAGAMLVPQLTRLGMHLDLLDTVPGSAERIENLWKKREEVDATVFELLVAAGLAERGRRPQFIPEMLGAEGRTPDLRCADPFPMVVECKRRQALSEYEADEEAAMRRVFDRLYLEARRLRLTGVFELRLRVEAMSLDPDEVIGKALLQRLPARPGDGLDYPWGSVAFRPLPGVQRLPGITKAYSPEMLEHCFGWNADLPEWDGLVCKADMPAGGPVREVRGAVAMTWTNISQAAVDKRSRAPVSLFGKANRQIPGGEFAIVYLCYVEGAREEIADRRMQQVADRLKDWEHSADFRIPVVFLNRLYPRALGSGVPDLIESTVQFFSKPAGADAWMSSAYPSCVFSHQERR